MKISFLFKALFVAFSLVTMGCATYQSKVHDSRNLLREGKISEALEKLKPLAEKPSDDQLVYLLDYGTALQIAGRYKESVDVLLKADKLTDLNDYHSVTNVVSATLGGEEMIQYKGESYEKFLINTMLAINFLSMGQFDDALVEVRRINEKISKMKMDGREPYELSPFATYLSAVLYEAGQSFDDAYIAYEKTYKLDASIPFLPSDLIRSAKKARRSDTAEKWKKEFPTVKEEPFWYDKTLGELIVIHQEGWGPQKQARPDNPRFPTLYPVGDQTRQAKIYIDDQDSGVGMPIYNVERVAMDTLSKDYGALIARRAGSYVAKAVVADQIRQKNEALGAVAWIAMNLSDRADVRQWSTLPKQIHMAKILLKPGKYKVRLQGYDGYGGTTKDALPEQEITVKPGQKVFINWRSLR